MSRRATALLAVVVLAAACGGLAGGTEVLSDEWLDFDPCQLGVGHIETGDFVLTPLDEMLDQIGANEPPGAKNQNLHVYFSCSGIE